MTTGHQTRIELGDFQTPPALADEVCALISRTGFEPASVLEPTCGTGAFLKAAVTAFPHTMRIVGFDREPECVAIARTALKELSGGRGEVRTGDFFELNWSNIVADMMDPLLVIGNPPWVTNSVLGSLGSSNLPKKSNLDHLRGIEALTGKSNFDISEWMLREALRWISNRHGMLAVLCKTSVARKVLRYSWSRNLTIQSADLYRIDAKAAFDVSVDACLLLVRTQPGTNAKECSIFDSLDSHRPRNVLGFRQGELVADVRLYDRWKHLMRLGLNGWRSGVKHDCSNVFELEPLGDAFTNGLGQRIEIENSVVFPLLKSSDLAGRRQPRKWLILPHRSMSESPELLEFSAPKAWKYLTEHSSLLDKRASSIYQGRPPFSIFGVGPYTFSPWKVAISGLYKKLAFVPVSTCQGKPVVLDDTCYFFPCDSQDECTALLRLITSNPAKEFLSSFIFWDSKRPITARVLNLLDLKALAQEVGENNDAARTLSERQIVKYKPMVRQRLLFRERMTRYGQKKKHRKPVGHAPPHG